MKHGVYIALFVVLGFLVQAFVHASVEIAYSLLLWKDYDLWSFGFSYDSWRIFHHFFTAVLLILGILYGYRGGVYWWGMLYQDNGELRPQYKKMWRI